MKNNNGVSSAAVSSSPEVLTAAGAVMLTACLCSWKYMSQSRSHNLIKFSQPSVVFMLIALTALGFTGVLISFATIKNNHHGGNSELLCGCQTVILDASWIFFVAILIAKNVRVDKIFNNVGLKKVVFSRDKVLQTAMKVAFPNVLIIMLSVVTRENMCELSTLTWPDALLYAYRVGTMVYCVRIARRVRGVQPEFRDSDTMFTLVSVWGSLFGVLLMLQAMDIFKYFDPSVFLTARAGVFFFVFTSNGCAIFFGKVFQIAKGEGDKHVPSLLQVASTVQMSTDSAEAAELAFRALQAELGGQRPHWLRVDITEELDADVVLQTLRKLGCESIPIQGATTSMGVITKAGVRFCDYSGKVGCPGVISLFGVRDPDGGRYSVGWASIEEGEGGGGG